MKNLFKVSALVLGLGLGLTQGANAAANTDPNLGLVGEAGVSFNSVTHAAKEEFTDEYDFSVSGGDLGASFTASFGKATQDYKKFDAWLANADGSKIDKFTFSKTNNDKTVNSDFSYDGLKAGNYELIVSGTGGTIAHGYTGSISVSPVPEAEEWAMMMLGLGVIGAVARNKKENGFKIVQG